MEIKSIEKVCEKNCYDCDSDCIHKCTVKTTDNRLVDMLLRSSFIYRFNKGLGHKSPLHVMEVSKALCL
jgi:hypothetical protein